MSSDLIKTTYENVLILICPNTTVHVPEYIFCRERLSQMLSKQRVPCGEQVAMLVNWVDGIRAQNFSFLSVSSSEL